MGDGSYYEGNFQNDEMNGEGIMKILIAKKNKRRILW